MKYILFGECGPTFPIVFPEFIQHADVRNAYRAEFPGIKAISAGFYSFNGEKAFVWGESISLKLKSNPAEDEYYLQKMFKND